MEWSPVVHSNLQPLSNSFVTSRIPYVRWFLFNLERISRCDEIWRCRHLPVVRQFLPVPFLSQVVIPSVGEKGVGLTLREVYEGNGSEGGDRCEGKGGSRVTGEETSGLGGERHADLIQEVWV